MATDPTSGGGFMGTGMSGSSLLGMGALGAGLGSLLSNGPGPLPAQFGQATNNAAWQTQSGQNLVSQGSGLVGSGQEAIDRAQKGQLTPEQQAQLNIYGQGLTNQSRQQFASMGMNPDQSTAFISQTAANDQQIMAMAQQQIQTTIQLGLGEISGGNSLISSGEGAVSAADQTLVAAGQAQIQQDKAYSDSLSSAFGAIGSLFGSVAGGPAGGAAGGAAGKAFGSLFS